MKLEELSSIQKYMNNSKKPFNLHLATYVEFLSYKTYLINMDAVVFEPMANFDHRQMPKPSAGVGTIGERTIGISLLNGRWICDYQNFKMAKLLSMNFAKCKKINQFQFISHFQSIWLISTDTSFCIKFLPLLSRYFWVNKFWYFDHSPSHMSISKLFYAKNQFFGQPETNHRWECSKNIKSERRNHHLRGH